MTGSKQGIIDARVTCKFNSQTEKYEWSRTQFSKCQKCPTFDFDSLDERVELNCMTKRRITWREMCEVKCANSGLLTVKASAKTVFIANGNPLKLRCQCQDSNCSQWSWQTPRRGAKAKSNSVLSTNFACSNNL